MVKIYPSGYKKIKMLGYKLRSNQPYQINNPHWSNQFYSIPIINNETFHNLVISGYHSLLVDSIPLSIQSKYIETNHSIKEIHDKKLLIVGLSNLYLPTKEIITEYYHFVLEHNGNIYTHYGIWANSLLTESQSEYDFLQNQFTLY